MKKYNGKPACYSCKWRRKCVGSAHSKCVHPKNKADLDDPLQAVMAIFGSVGRMPNMQSGGLKVEGNPHGIKNGWFNYPFNFDPVWLEECEGFELKQQSQEDKDES